MSHTQFTVHDVIQYTVFQCNTVIQCNTVCHCMPVEYSTLHASVGLVFIGSIPDRGGASCHTLSTVIQCNTVRHCMPVVYSTLRARVYKEQTTAPRIQTVIMVLYPPTCCQFCLALSPGLAFVWRSRQGRPQACMSRQNAFRQSTVCVSSTKPD